MKNQFSHPVSSSPFALLSVLHQHFFFQCLCIITNIRSFRSTVIFFSLQTHVALLLYKYAKSQLSVWPYKSLYLTDPDGSVIAKLNLFSTGLTYSHCDIFSQEIISTLQEHWVCVCGGAVISCHTAYD